MRTLTLLFISVSLLFSNILCREKIEKELVLLEGGYPSWTVDRENLITFNPNLIKDTNFTKREPLLGLYLIKNRGGLVQKEKMLFRDIRNSFRFAIDDENYISGKLVKPQIGLEFAEFSEYIEDNLMIISGCCVTAGLSIGGKKFIDANYIKHFIETDNAHLSDIGARFIEIDKRIFVKSVNPFFTDNPFLENDEILYIDNEPIQSIDKFLQNILFSPQNRVIDFEILRGNQLVEISVETSILKGGGFLSDTFLENIGVWLDESLFVTNVHKESAFAKKGLRNSYRLLSINGENLKNEDEIRKFLSSLKADIPNKFNFLFKLKEKELKIELTSNKKYFKNIKKNEMGSFGNFSFGSLTTGSNMGTGDFDFSGNWNGTFKDDKNDTFYDIYNSIPLAEYLSY